MFVFVKVLKIFNIFGEIIWNLHTCLVYPDPPAPFAWKPFEPKLMWKLISINLIPLNSDWKSQVYTSKQPVAKLLQFRRQRRQPIEVSSKSPVQINFDPKIKLLSIRNHRSEVMWLKYQDVLFRSFEVLRPWSCPSVQGNCKGKHNEIC